jgi:hypothetical protein
LSNISSICYSYIGLWLLFLLIEIVHTSVSRYVKAGTKTNQKHL